MESTDETQDRLRAALRLTAFLSVTALLSGGFLLHRAQAELGERALTVGRELTRLHAVHQGTTELNVNGARMALNSASRDEPVETILDRFAALCAAGAPDLQAEIAAAKQQGAKLPDASSFGILRSAPSEREGTAACFVREKRDGVRGLLADLERAVASGDLSQVGQLRYLYARRSARGEGTHVLTVWSRGPLRPADMFPAQGDVPGNDLVAGVRPLAARRLLTAHAQGTKLEAVFYETSRTPAEVLHDYDQGLRSHGYSALLAEVMEGAVPVPTRVYRKDDEDELVVLADPQGDRTMVSSFRLGTHGNVRFSQ